MSYQNIPYWFSLFVQIACKFFEKENKKEHVVENFITSNHSIHILNFYFAGHNESSNITVQKGAITTNTTTKNTSLQQLNKTYYDSF